MKSKIYGFENYDEEDLYYSLANDHALSTLRGLLEYFQGFKEQAEMNPWEYQGLESLKDLKKGIELLEEAEKYILKAGGEEINMTNSDTKKLVECKEIAKAYCTKNEYEYIYADLYSFGYEDKNGNLVKKYWNDLYKELGGKE